MNIAQKLEKNPITEKLVKFIDALNLAKEVYWKQSGFTFNNPPKVMIHSMGAKYIRLAEYEERPAMSGNLVASSVYCFVDARNGDVLKAAGWKTPAPNGVRGNLNNENVLEAAGIHGLQYLTGANGCSVASIIKTGKV